MNEMNNKLFHAFKKDIKENEMLKIEDIDIKFGRFDTDIEMKFTFLD